MNHDHRHGPASMDRQIVLPFAKSLEISFNSIRVRFFRSMITVSSLILAVAFLAYTLMSLDVATGFLRHGGAEAAKVLTAANYDVDSAAGTVAMGAKERWIIILSLLVCTVGIVNAQLMSVTERFREIGVMKCLGALDSMVLRLFLLEAAMQGLAGAFLGAILGGLMAFLLGGLHYGFDAVVALPAESALVSFGVAVASGLLLSLAGVFYPALVAMKMRPIMALRAEM